MSAPELKPCPFCGASVSLEKAEVGRNPKEWWGVVCRGTKNLGGTCAIQQRASRTKEAAITRWNTRADLAPPPAKEKPSENDEQLRIWAQEILEALALADVLDVREYHQKVDAHCAVMEELRGILAALEEPHRAQDGKGGGE